MFHPQREPEKIPAPRVVRVAGWDGRYGLPGQSQRFGESRRLLAFVRPEQQQVTQEGQPVRMVWLVRGGGRYGLPREPDRLVEKLIRRRGRALMEAAVDSGQTAQAQGASGIIVRQLFQRVFDKFGGLHAGLEIVGADGERLDDRRQVHQPAVPVTVPRRGRGQRLPPGQYRLLEQGRIPRLQEQAVQDRRKVAQQGGAEWVVR